MAIPTYGTPPRRSFQIADRLGLAPGGAGRSLWEVEARRAAGRTAADELGPAATDRVPMRRVRQRARRLRASLTTAMGRTTTAPAVRSWLAENARLLSSAELDAREFLWTARDYPTVHTGSHVMSRVECLASAYVAATGARGFGEGTLAAFLLGVQERVDLQSGEVWAMRGALMLLWLGAVTDAAEADDAATMARAIESIRAASDANWQHLFATVSIVERTLAADPAGAYPRMDAASRDGYRRAVASIARRGRLSEREVAEAALCLAEAAAETLDTPDDAVTRRRGHVGYWLVDEGRGTLDAMAGVRLPLGEHLTRALIARPTLTYVGGVLTVTVAVVLAVLHGLDLPTPWLAFGLLLLPAMQAAVELVNALVPAIVPPRVLPKLDFSRGIPQACETMVAVPALLLDAQHVHELVMDLEVRYLANRDSLLHFALLTDSVDAVDGVAEEDDPLVPLAVGLIDGLNARYGTPSHTPFYLFHRHRVYNPSEQRWMGWERKRGKLLDLNRLLRGSFDAFPVKVGALDALPRIRYVITLDSDTQLPLESAHRLVGTLAHPLNRAVIDAGTQQVIRGYGILQPRIGISTQSASRSWLARLLSGQTGYDLYTRAISDAYQDLFGEGIFTGKGIYDVDAFHAVLEHRFPENALLSHDLIEGVFARAALVSDIELIDDYPTHFSAYSRRKHRWMRGDWQILRWLLPVVPDGLGRRVRNRSSAISRWKILDNLRRSLLEPATLALLLAGWFALPGGATLWTAVTLGMLCLPACGGLVVSLARASRARGRRLRAAASAVGAWLRQVILTLVGVTFLLHDALLALDAAVRSLARVHVTRQRLLEWETAAAARTTHGPRRPADVYLQWSPWLALCLAVLMSLARPSAAAAAVPVLVLWTAARPLASWLGRAPRGVTVALTGEDEAWLRTQGWRLWRYFREHCTERRRWMVPDHVGEDGVAAERLSPTNLGFLLDARIAAVHFGHLTVEEFARETLQTLDGLRTMPFERGHLLNWSDVETGQALEPAFVSTVDSGNLVASLWTLKQAAMAFQRDTPGPDVLWSGILDLGRVLQATTDPEAHALAERVARADRDRPQALTQLEALARHVAADLRTRSASACDIDARWWVDELVTRLVAAERWTRTGLTARTRRQLVDIASRVDSLVSAMDFTFLYHPRKKTLSVGYDAASGRVETSTYDLLASEARIAAFVAIAKGDVPQESWTHLGRSHVAAGGTRVLASWTGTMFEYLMPVIWMRHHPRTILRDSLAAVIRLQRRYTRERALPWGISESAFVPDGSSDPDTTARPEYGYAPFGLPAVSRSPRASGRLVVAPYASYLALAVDPRASLQNLRRLERDGWHGACGLYEAIDFNRGQAIPVRTWMAHHQGMSLLSVCNLLCDNVLQRYFHAEPQVVASDLLLHERVPALTVADLEEWLVPPPRSIDDVEAA